MKELKRINEFEWNVYKEKTGCPQQKVVLAYEDKDFQTDGVSQGGLVRQILSQLDIERITNLYLLADPQTGAIENSQRPIFRPAKFNFDLDFRPYGAFHPMPHNSETVQKVPKTPREFLDAYEILEKEGIDMILANVGNDHNWDYALDVENQFAAERRTRKEALVEWLSENCTARKNTKPSKDMIKVLMHVLGYEITKRPLSQQASEIIEILEQKYPLTINKGVHLTNSSITSLIDKYLPNQEKVREIKKIGVLEKSIMSSPNKPILVNLVPEEESEKYFKAVEARYRKKGIEPKKIEHVFSEAEENKFYRMDLKGRPELIRYFFCYNHKNSESLKTLLPKKLHTYLVRMHEQVPSTHDEQKDRDDHKEEYELQKQTRILEMREIFYRRDGQSEKANKAYRERMILEGKPLASETSKDLIAIQENIPQTTSEQQTTEILGTVQTRPTGGFTIVQTNPKSNKRPKENNPFAF